MPTPETNYARTSDGVHIAYQVSGRGSVDFLWSEGWLSHVEVLWELPSYARWMQAFGDRFRVIHFDKRGMGLSDRAPTPNLESRMEDVRTVLDAVGSERAVLFGEGPDGGGITAMYAATEPTRVYGLVLWHFKARAAWAPDYPWGTRPGEPGRYLGDDNDIASIWGREEPMREWAEQLGALSPLDDPHFARWAAKYVRYAASPGAVLEQSRIWFETDLRDVLPAIHVPTLFLYRREYAGMAREEVEYLRDLIPGAQAAPVGGTDEQPYFGDPSDMVTQVTRFVDAIRSEEAELDRVLATVMFTDIVGSTGKAAELGDARWKEQLQRHHTTVRALLSRYRGFEVDTAGDGFFATFDGPARGIRCAKAIVEAMRPLGLSVRVGVHTGEVQTIDRKIGGMAVLVGARVGALAGPGEVLATSTVRDLTAGSGLVFEDAGERELKGVPDRWRLYHVAE
jgi:class 3 adenylate cyclase